MGEFTFSDSSIKTFCGINTAERGSESSVSVARVEGASLHTAKCASDFCRTFQGWVVGSERKRDHGELRPWHYIYVHSIESRA